MKRKHLLFKEAVCKNRISLSVIIQMKTTEQFFLVVLFTMFYKVFQTFESLIEILGRDHSNESYCLRNNFRWVKRMYP